jgi:hypothetical protein
MRELLDRVGRLEDRAEIQDLAVRYCFAIDSHDYDKLRSMFTADACLRTHSGRIKGLGVDGIMAYFESHLPSLGPSNHFVHGHIVEFDDGERDRATGIVASHAELGRNGTPMITAIRYLDKYERVVGRWRFRERIQSYMYFVDVREYSDVLVSELRIRTTKDNPQPADWPIPVK